MTLHEFLNLVGIRYNLDNSISLLSMEIVFIEGDADTCAEIKSVKVNKENKIIELAG